MIKLSPITEVHYPALASIYLEGIATGQATFETKAPTWESWDNAHLKFCRIGAFQNAELVGWTALSPVSSRCVYGGVAELSVYVAQAARGKGIGVLLLKALIKESELNNIWTLQAGIFRNNEASIALHEKCGFRMIGYREKIGKLNDNWIDNVLMERRSKVTGVN